MRSKIRIIFVGGLAVLALSGIASASASANTFVFNYTGTGANKAKFTATTGEVKLVGADGSEWGCQSSATTGEVSGASGSSKVAHVVVTLSGCKFGTKVCTTAGQASGVMKSAELEGELGYLSETKMGEVGLLLKPKLGSFMSCREGTALIEFKGGLIGLVSSVNRMGKSFNVQYSQNRGSQELTKFVGGAENALQVSYNGGSSWNGAGIEAAVTDSPSEGEIEIAETL
jgi:hypothetical protein